MGVQAQRLLLRSALQDPLNQRFVFLSETCAPLIPAATMYAQLMSEPKSRINACRKPDWDLNLDRSARPRAANPCLYGTAHGQLWRGSSSQESAVTCALILCGPLGGITDLHLPSGHAVQA